MKILLMTDMEGVAGVLNRDEWTRPGAMYYEVGKRLTTLEANAAVDGFFAGGATEVLVVDGHGPGAINPELLDERALLMRGASQPTWPWGLDGSYAGVAWVGQHAKAGTPYSHLTHTQSFHMVDLSINGISIGEFGQLALCARELGVPSVLACGEEALCHEAAALAPGIVTASMKRGLLPDGLDDADMETYAKSKLSAIHLSPARARKEVREAAQHAIEKLRADRDAFSYIDLQPPYVRCARFRKSGDQPAYDTRDEHASSMIELMNMPMAERSAQARPVGFVR